MARYNLLLCCFAVEKSQYIYKYLNILTFLHLTFIITHLTATLAESKYFIDPLFLFSLVIHFLLLCWTAYFICLLKNKRRRFDYKKSNIKMFVTVLIVLFIFQFLITLSAIAYSIISIQIVKGLMKYKEDEKVTYEEYF